MSFSFPHPFTLGQENQLINTPQIHGGPSGLQEGELFPRKRKRTQTEVPLDAPKKRCRIQDFADICKTHENNTLPLGNVPVSALDTNPAPPAPSSSNCFFSLTHGDHFAEPSLGTDLLGQGFEQDVFVQNGVHNLSPLSVGQAFDIPSWVQGDNWASLVNRSQDKFTHTVTGPNPILFGDSQQSIPSQNLNRVPLPLSDDSLPMSTQFTPGLIESLGMYDVLPLEQPISKLAISKRNGKVRDDSHVKCRIGNIDDNGLVLHGADGCLTDSVASLMPPAGSRWHLTGPPMQVLNSQMNPFTSLADSLRSLPACTQTLSSCSPSMPTWMNDTNHPESITLPDLYPGNHHIPYIQCVGDNTLTHDTTLKVSTQIAPLAQPSLPSPESFGMMEHSQVSRIKESAATPVPTKDTQMKDAGGGKTIGKQKLKKRSGTRKKDIQTGTYKEIKFAPPYTTPSN